MNESDIIKHPTVRSTADRCDGLELRVQALEDTVSEMREVNDRARAGAGLSVNNGSWASNVGCVAVILIICATIIMARMIDAGVLG